MDDRSKQQCSPPSYKEVFSEEAEEIFCTAIEMEDIAEQHAFVERACRRDVNLLARVEKLMASQMDVERFFQASSPALEVSDQQDEVLTNKSGHQNRIGFEAGAEEQPGCCVGPYKLLQAIGEGGCGTVYMAEQDIPVRRRVALKIVKLGMDTKSVIARFEAERQALAMMDHPNIAHVFDAGTTETGRPYFVMELVRGVRITSYCDQNQLDTYQRLQLFIQVCHAIQHAHQKGIVHRDIKPSNILVTVQDGLPIPVVIDFGIAKAVQGRLTNQTLFTPYEQFIGTPAYMSPEQAEMSRVDVDTRSDIYSLGVLLYELLAGRTPFDSTQLLECGVDEMRRTLREREPLRPSTIVTSLLPAELTKAAHCRHAEPLKLISMLKGDLDWIVMRALEKDRSRRYQTANGMAMDVQRYLDNEPILARPPSQLYRLRKLVRRNKAVFVSGAAVAAALALGLGVAIILLIRANAAERQEARLRGIAEKGLAMEAELRHQAEGREKIVRAAMLVDRGLYAEADLLVAQLPLEQSTMEGAEVFRALGEWNAIHEHWSKAKDRFHLLQQASRSNKPVDASLDWTRTAIAIIKSDDPEGYDRYCQDAVRTFGDTQDPTVAGRTIRNCLLVPVSSTQLNSLKSVVKCAMKSLEGRNFTNNIGGWQIPWRCQVLALWEYRSGNYSEAIAWSHRCFLGDDHPPVRSASARLVLAMSLQHLGKIEDARSELKQARAVIEPMFEKPLDIGDSDNGVWYDWVIGDILLSEAVALIDSSSGDAD